MIQSDLAMGCCFVFYLVLVDNSSGLRHYVALPPTCTLSTLNAAVGTFNLGRQLDDLLGLFNVDKSSCWRPQHYWPQFRGHYFDSQHPLFHLGLSASSSSPTHFNLHTTSLVKPLATVQPESCSLGSVNWCWSGISSQIPWAQYSCCDSCLSFDPSFVSALRYGPAASLAQTPPRRFFSGTGSLDL